MKVMIESLIKKYYENETVIHNSVLYEQLVALYDLNVAFHNEAIRMKKPGQLEASEYHLQWTIERMCKLTKNDKVVQEIVDQVNDLLKMASPIQKELLNLCGTPEYAIKFNWPELHKVLHVILKNIGK